MSENGAVLDKADLKARRIGVLMGGLSREREISLKSGAGCRAALEALGYDTVGIDVSREAADQLKGEGVEVAFLALHGRFGEDGVMQGLLELMGIPYTGSRVLSSALCMNKVRTKQIAAWHGIPTPAFVVAARGADSGDAAAEAERRLKFPVMVKPCEEGSSLGVIKVDDPASLKEAFETTCRDYADALAEEFVAGEEITVGLLESAASVEALPVLQLKPRAAFYDFHAKYHEGMTEFIVPARLPEEVAARARQLAVQAFRALGCRGFSRVDFIMGPGGAPQLTEINTIPGMTGTSDLPAAAAAAGISYEELVEKMLGTALLP